MVMASSGCEPPPSPPSCLGTFQFERNRRIENLGGPYDMVQSGSDSSSEPLFTPNWTYLFFRALMQGPELTTLGLARSNRYTEERIFGEKVKELTPDGSLVSEVTVRNISRPRQSIKVATDRYAVCYGYGPPPELHRVCLVNGNRETIKCYGGVSGYGDGQLDIPARLELSKEKCTLVADAGNRRVRRQTSISSEI